MDWSVKIHPLVLLATENSSFVWQMSVSSEICNILWCIHPAPLLSPQHVHASSLTPSLQINTSNTAHPPSPLHPSSNTHTPCSELDRYGEEVLCAGQVQLCRLTIPLFPLRPNRKLIRFCYRRRWWNPFHWGHSLRTLRPPSLSEPVWRSESFSCSTSSLISAIGKK